MERPDPDIYSSLHDLLKADPEWVYTTQNPCICPIRHKHQELSVAGYENIMIVRESLATLDVAEEEIHRRIQKIPGALGDEQTSPALLTLSILTLIQSTPIAAWLAPRPVPNTFYIKSIALGANVCSCRRLELYQHHRQWHFRRSILFSHSFDP
jgi:hypothetical protein